MKRLAAMQLCPVLISRDVTQVATAASRSASSRMRYGSLPPSSSTHFLSAAPARAATARPARVLPVNVTAATRGSSITAPTRLSSRRNTWNSPSGTPAVRSTSWIASAQPVTFGACLSRAAFPATRAGAAKRNTCQKGKFHGMIASTVPIGR